MTEALIWAGIILCMSQSALFSGSNLAVFSLSRLRLEAAASTGDVNAKLVLGLREDANRTLVTILVGNVAVNVLLTLLADSVFAGLAAFLFSTVVITLVGEIIPQAYLTRHALRSIVFLSPLLRFWRFILWPVAKPIALALDRWIGREVIPWFGEQELQSILRYHARGSESEIGAIEAAGAINVLAMDDLLVRNVGKQLKEEDTIPLEFRGDRPTFPNFRRSNDDPFVLRLARSGRRWVVIADRSDEPRLALDADRLLRDALLAREDILPDAYCHAPMILRNPEVKLDTVLSRLTERRQRGEDEEEVILLWTSAERWIVTGDDLLCYLTQEVASDTETASPAAE